MEATSTGAAERYVLGQMGDRERDQYEEHFFECPECAQEVRATAIFVDNAESLLGRKAGPDPGEPARGEPAKGRIGWRALFWPVPLGAAATVVVLLGLSGYQGLVVLPRMTDELRQADTIQSVSTQFLSRPRGDEPVVKVSAGQRKLVLTLSPSADRPLPFLRCELQTADGRALRSEVLSAPPAGQELEIVLPVHDLQTGRYVLSVRGLESPSAAPSAKASEYRFVLENVP